MNFEVYICMNFKSHHMCDICFKICVGACVIEDYVLYILYRISSYKIYFASD
jgi:hypothetical protein